MIKKLALGAAIGAALLSSGASAAALDFVAYANAHEKGVADGAVIDFNGVAVGFYATGGFLVPANAYFDGDNGGLGVCKVLTSPDKQCNPSDDDNITANEVLTLEFANNPQTIHSIVFHAEGHTPTLHSETLLFSINNAPLVRKTFDEVAAGIYTDVLHITFAYDNAGTNADQFYIASAVAGSPVPLPAAAPLMLGALGALGAARRRKAA